MIIDTNRLGLTLPSLIPLIILVQEFINTADTSVTASDMHHRLP